MKGRFERIQRYDNFKPVISTPCRFHHRTETRNPKAFSAQSTQNHANKSSRRESQVIEKFASANKGVKRSLRAYIWREFVPHGAFAERFIQGGFVRL
jgi:hypothetical protein